MSNIKIKFNFIKLLLFIYGKMKLGDDIVHKFINFI